VSHKFNAHNLFYKELARIWQPILRADGFGTFNAHRLERREGFEARTILLKKAGHGVRVDLTYHFHGHAVREVPYTQAHSSNTDLHWLELSPDPSAHWHYTFSYGDTLSAVRANADALVDAYMRVARPFFRLA
jgi:hypothetical protein